MQQTTSNWPATIPRKNKWEQKGVLSDSKVKVLNDENYIRDHVQKNTPMMHSNSNKEYISKKNVSDSRASQRFFKIDDQNRSMRHDFRSNEDTYQEADTNFNYRSQGMQHLFCILI